MGTHSLIIMRVQKVDETYQIWSVLYQQYDGYVEEGVGKKLFYFLYNMKIVNGIRITHKTDKNDKIANGAGDLFAQIIGYFKKKVGGAYLCSPDPEDGQLEEYNYYVDVKDDYSINITVKDSEAISMFSGTVEEALEFYKIPLDGTEDVPIYKI